MASTKIADLPDGGSIQPNDEFVIARGAANNFKILGSAIAHGVPAGANIYYVSALGNDSNSGTSLAEPKQTFAAAIALTGPYDAVVCLEGGTFSESLTLPAHPMHLYAPNITLTSSASATLSITGLSKVVLGVLLNDTGNALSINSTEASIINTEVIEGAGNAITIVNTDAVSFICARNMNGNQDYNSSSCNVTINELVSGAVFNSENIQGQIGDKFYGMVLPEGLPDYTHQWYVSSEIGNDSNSGLNQAEPFASITAAVNAWNTAGVSGSIVILDSETYNENITFPSSVFVPILYGPTASINGSLTLDTSCIVRLGSVTNGAGSAITISTSEQIDLFVRNISASVGYAINCTATGGGVIYAHRSTDNFDFNGGSYFVGIGKVAAPLVSGGSSLVGYIGATTYAWNNGGTADQDNIIYVGKHGDDSNSGLNIAEAKLTFGAAYTAAAVGDSIVCLDGGTYDEYITISKNISIFAPNAIIKSSSNAANWTVNLNSTCSVNFKEISHASLIGLVLQSADPYIVKAQKIAGGGANQSVLSTTSVGIGTITADEVSGNIDCNNSSYAIQVDKLLSGSVVDGGSIYGRVGNTLYGMQGIQLPFATAGAGGQYSTIKAAIDAGHKYVYVIGNTVETSDISLSADTYHIYCVETATVSMNSYGFVFGGPYGKLYLSGGAYQYAYNSVKFMVASNPHPDCELYLRDLTVTNTSTAANCSINDAAMTVNASNVTFYLGNIDGGGINGTRSDMLSDIHLVGGGANCYNGLFNLNDVEINNLQISGTWSNSSFVVHCAEYCCINNVLAANEGGGTTITLLVIGVLSNVNNKNNGTIINVTCGNDGCSLSSLKLNGGSINPQTFGNHSIIDVDGAGIDSSISNTDNMLVSNCAFSQAVTLQGNGCCFSNCRFAFGLNIFANCNYNRIVNSIAGDLDSPGSSVSFSVQSGATGTSIVGCATDAAIVDFGTGTQTAANVVF